MLQQFTWQNYITLIALLLIVYYGYILLRWYRTEIRATIKSNKSQSPLFPSSFNSPEQPDVIGIAKPVQGAAIHGEELLFAPSEEAENYGANPIPVKEDNELVSAFSDMVAEIKTLIRVIADSNDSRENFEMLFQLEVQKFGLLAGTPYQEKVNHFLIKESAGKFPFGLHISELDNYWQTIQA
ncbi:hypothetical protein [Mucilaginibacter conchicola]|nr:hypothetical protein [Mucilaginibacter conchicola]